uniref:Uncharacterized protein n=1 Tax=Vespula pensylvanica TaxID=30213 RepID=A0A834P2Y4_VESPE|nr:hypothetical protein H0235_008192 [Vespula pensylvanica]
MSGSAIRWTFRKKERGQVTCKTTRFAKLPFADSPVENDFPRGEGLIENVVRSALAVTEGIMVMHIRSSKEYIAFAKSKEKGKEEEENKRRVGRLNSLGSTNGA